MSSSSGYSGAGNATGAGPPITTNTSEEVAPLYSSAMDGISASTLAFLVDASITQQHVAMSNNASGGGTITEDKVATGPDATSSSSSSPMVLQLLCLPGSAHHFYQRDMAHYVETLGQLSSIHSMSDVLTELLATSKETSMEVLSCLRQQSSSGVSVFKRRVFAAALPMVPGVYKIEPPLPATATTAATNSNSTHNNTASGPSLSPTSDGISLHCVEAGSSGSMSTAANAQRAVLCEVLTKRAPGVHEMKRLLVSARDGVLPIYIAEDARVALGRDTSFSSALLEEVDVSQCTVFIMRSLMCIGSDLAVFLAKRQVDSTSARSTLSQDTDVTTASTDIDHILDLSPIYHFSKLSNSEKRVPNTAGFDTPTRSKATKSVSPDTKDASNGVRKPSVVASSPSSTGNGARPPRRPTGISKTPLPRKVVRVVESVEEDGDDENDVDENAESPVVKTRRATPHPTKDTSSSGRKKSVTGGNSDGARKPSRSVRSIAALLEEEGQDVDGYEEEASVGEGSSKEDSISNVATAASSGARPPRRPTGISKTPLPRKAVRVIEPVGEDEEDEEEESTADFNNYSAETPVLKTRRATPHPSKSSAAGSSNSNRKKSSAARSIAALLEDEDADQSDAAAEDEKKQDSGRIISSNTNARPPRRPTGISKTPLPRKIVRVIEPVEEDEEDEEDQDREDIEEVDSGFAYSYNPETPVVKGRRATPHPSKGSYGANSSPSVHLSSAHASESPVVTSKPARRATPFPARPKSAPGLVRNSTNATTLGALDEYDEAEADARKAKTSVSKVAAVIARHPTPHPEVRRTTNAAGISAAPPKRKLINFKEGWGAIAEAGDETEDDQVGREVAGARGDRKQRYAFEDWKPQRTITSTKTTLTKSHIAVTSAKTQTRPTTAPIRRGARGDEEANVPPQRPPARPAESGPKSVNIISDPMTVQRGSVAPRMIEEEDFQLDASVSDILLRASIIVGDEFDGDSQRVLFPQKDFGHPVRVVTHDASSDYNNMYVPSMSKVLLSASAIIGEFDGVHEDTDDRFHAADAIHGTALGHGHGHGQWNIDLPVMAMPSEILFSASLLVDASFGEQMGHITPRIETTVLGESNDSLVKLPLHDAGVGFDKSSWFETEGDHNSSVNIATRAPSSHDVGYRDTAMPYDMNMQRNEDAMMHNISARPSTAPSKRVHNEPNKPRRAISPAERGLVYDHANFVVKMPAPYGDLLNRGRPKSSAPLGSGHGRGVTTTTNTSATSSLPSGVTSSDAAVGVSGLLQRRQQKNKAGNEVKNANSTCYRQLYAQHASTISDSPVALVPEVWYGVCFDVSVVEPRGSSTLYVTEDLCERHCTDSTHAHHNVGLRFLLDRAQVVNVNGDSKEDASPIGIWMVAHSGVGRELTASSHKSNAKTAIAPAIKTVTLRDAHGVESRAISTVVKNINADSCVHTYGTDGAGHDRQFLRAGDEILSINGFDIGHMGLVDLKGLLVGLMGSSQSLQLRVRRFMQYPFPDSPANMVLDTTSHPVIKSTVLFQNVTKGKSSAMKPKHNLKYMSNEPHLQEGEFAMKAKINEENFDRLVSKALKVSYGQSYVPPNIILTNRPSTAPAHGPLRPHADAPQSLPRENPTHTSTFTSAHAGDARALSPNRARTPSPGRSLSRKMDLLVQKTNGDLMALVKGRKVRHPSRASGHGHEYRFVVEEIRPDSNCFRQGLLAIGDEVLEINGIPIKDPSSLDLGLRSMHADTDEYVLVRIKRGNLSREDAKNIDVYGSSFVIKKRQLVSSAANRNSNI